MGPLRALAVQIHLRIRPRGSLSSAGAGADARVTAATTGTWHLRLTLAISQEVVTYHVALFFPPLVDFVFLP